MKYIKKQKQVMNNENMIIKVELRRKKKYLFI